MSKRRGEEKEFNFMMTLPAWFLTVTGTTIASLPQYFIVQFALPAWVALVIGIPILAVGGIMLVLAWLPERQRKYPEILEYTQTPIPKVYIEEAKKEGLL
ncbi:MAG: hypothetical protein NZ988_04925 [Thaumarchaeota archaeon]|nr:hypothetical protein [Candidatus Calditenuaceae archaeon]MDW8187369.1 hypothetical protein [Nitrososphaerota archaeon]